MSDQFRKNIFLPCDADHNDPEWWDLVPYGVQDAIDNIEYRPRIIRWLCRMWCKLFGHRIKTYTGGFEYKAMKGNVWGGRKGQEKRPQRYYKKVLLKEGYCRCCGKHFSNSYIKKHKIHD